MTLDIRGKWILITGASTGIGKAFAYECARCGANLILVARSEDKLRQIAADIHKQYGVDADVIPMDLTDPDAPQRLYNQINRPVFSLINNAGFGTHTRFHESDFRRNQDMVKLNVQAVMALTHLFLPRMVQANDGLIINLASVVAFQPTPYMAVYGASKAFVLSFTEALWAEYGNTNIKFLAVCPGPTETPFFDVADARDVAGQKLDTPKNVVREAFNALESGKHYVVTGPVTNYLATQASRLLPRSWVAKISGFILRPKKQ